MNSPVIMLEEQLGDIHSSQIAYKLTVRNASAEPPVDNGAAAPCA